MERLAAIVLMMSAMAAAQDIKHAPAVEQCRADQPLWLSEFENAGVNVPATYSTLNQWIFEMVKCEEVDPENRMRYQNTMSEAAANQQVRLEDFLIQHRLLEQFLDEDKAGKR